MITNCGALGLDYRTASLGEYFEALEAHNDAHAGPEGKGQSDPAKLAKVVEARRG